MATKVIYISNPNSVSQPTVYWAISYIFWQLGREIAPADVAKLHFGLGPMYGSNSIIM